MTTGMESMGLIVGHMIGDYVLQNDWMAANKTNPRPAFADWDDYQANAVEARRRWVIGHAACTVHCLLYTLAVWACSFWWMPWWGLAVCFACHWPLDRFRLAGRWMRNVSGQAAFAGGILSPWSVIVVDNTAHLLTLFVIGLLA